MSCLELYLDFSFIYYTVYTVQWTYASLNTAGIKFKKLIIVWNISNMLLFV